MGKGSNSSYNQETSSRFFSELHKEFLSAGIMELTERIGRTY
jgi:hypothetical protein